MPVSAPRQAPGGERGQEGRGEEREAGRGAAGTGGWGPSTGVSGIEWPGNLLARAGSSSFFPSPPSPFLVLFSPVSTAVAPSPPPVAFPELPRLAQHQAENAGKLVNESQKRRSSKARWARTARTLT